MGKEGSQWSHLPPARPNGWPEPFLSSNQRRAPGAMYACALARSPRSRASRKFFTMRILFCCEAHATKAARNKTLRIFFRRLGAQEVAMAIDVVMPQMGESIAEGTVVRW